MLAPRIAAEDKVEGDDRRPPLRQFLDEAGVQGPRHPIERGCLIQRFEPAETGRASLQRLGPGVLGRGQAPQPSQEVAVEADHDRFIRRRPGPAQTKKPAEPDILLEREADLAQRRNGTERADKRGKCQDTQINVQGRCPRQAVPPRREFFYPKSRTRLVTIATIAVAFLR